MFFNKKLKPLLITSLLATSALISCSEKTNPGNPTSEIDTYDILCDTTEFQEIYKNYEGDKYIPITLSYKGHTYTAKMRIRGDTSRKDPKKSLKIKFDSSVLKGLPKTINLNAEYADKTYIRQFLSSFLIQKAGQICFKSKHVKVLLNGKFFGLFLQIENTDKQFLKRNNLSKRGNLYKATKDGACLSIFDDINIKWEKKTNKKSDHNDLKKLIHDLNTIPNEKFESFIKKTFIYDEFINMVSLNMFLSNGSTYYHNYYLYHDLYNDGKWKLLPWDLDKTLSYYNWMPYTYHRTSSEWESDNPLIERSLICPVIFNDIRTRIKELHKSYLNNEYVSPIIDSLTSLLSTIIPLDTSDKIGSQKEWISYINKEKAYFDNHFELLQQQFNEQPHSFEVFRFNQIQTDTITFKWRKSHHPLDKTIQYTLTYGTDFLLTDSAKTSYINEINDTFYTLKTPLQEDTYYWKVTASDGKYFTDGFNTKNMFEVKKGTLLPTNITSDMILTKEESPYLVTQNITVKKGVLLTIEEGTEIHLNQNVCIHHNGNTFARGTLENPILLIPRNTATHWGYIFFHKPSEQTYLEHVILKEGTINSEGKALTLKNSSILVNNKPMGTGNQREVLIYSNRGKILVQNSTFKSNGFGEGMVLFRGEAITENSSFDNIPDAIEYILMDKGEIRNNYVTNSPDDAIDLNACNNIIIENNMLFYNKDKAISIGTEQYGPSIDNIQIKNNLIVGNKTAIAIKDSSVASISNNTLFKNISGINAYKKRDDYVIGGKAYIKNTIFEKNEKTNAYADKWSQIEVAFSIVNNKILAGNANIKGDPEFINAKGNDFHLKQSSPCLGKGEKGSDIGAFASSSKSIRLHKVHPNLGKEGAEEAWIQLVNNYNIPLDLSLYRLVISVNDKSKEFIFPIGTVLNGLKTTYIVENYYTFKEKNKTPALIFGGLPKLNGKNIEIRLFNSTNYLIDSCSLSTKSMDMDDITFVNLSSVGETKRVWKLESE